MEKPHEQDLHYDSSCTHKLCCSMVSYYCSLVHGSSKLTVRMLHSCPPSWFSYHIPPKLTVRMQHSCPPSWFSYHIPQKIDCQDAAFMPTKLVFTPYSQKIVAKVKASGLAYDKTVVGDNNDMLPLKCCCSDKSSHL